MDLQLVESILPFVAVGFLAQLVDGALGMAFGVITNTLLISVLGVAPARASASVHIVECFTTAESGISHIAHGNVDWRLFGRLVIPGAIGGIAGAYLLSSIDAAGAGGLWLHPIFWFRAVSPGAQSVRSTHRNSS